ncbi:hypothetical protein RQP46_003121 [Phenoliferia psychrophenolica]
MSDSRATAVTLPTELLEEIFELAASLKRATSLARFALVCRTWRQPAQRALFTNVILKSGRAARNWLACPARSRYRTKHLQFGQWALIPLGLEVLEAAPSAISLTLTVIFDPRHSGYTYCTSVQGAGLKKLSLRTPGALPSDPKPFTCRLRYLELYHTNTVYQSNYQFILLPSRDTLETLHLIGDISDLTDYVASAGPFPKVKHLILDEISSHVCLNTLVTSFPSLARLDISTHLPPIVLAAFQATAAGALRDLTLRLENAVWTEATFESLLRAFDLPFFSTVTCVHLASLGKVDLASTTSGMALLEECEKRSISLECRYGYLTTDMINEDSPAPIPDHQPFETPPSTA